MFTIDDSVKKVKTVTCYFQGKMLYLLRMCFWLNWSLLLNIKIILFFYICISLHVNLIAIFQMNSNIKWYYSNISISLGWTLVPSVLIINISNNVINIICIFHKFKQVGKNDFLLRSSDLGTIYPLFCMKLKLCHGLNLLLKDYVINLLLYLYVFVACNCICCTCMLSQFCLLL